MLTEIQPMEHFSAMVTKAIKGQGIKASPMAEFYLSNLLSNYVESRRLPEEPFSTRLLKALGEEGEVKKILLKEVGDSSLFLTGFFHESLKKKIVDVDYYIGIGIISYSSLADYFCERGRGRNKTLSALYAELSEKFQRFVDVLDEISEESGIFNALDILRIYERWLRTKSPRIEAILKDLGIEPVGVPTRLAH